jgi:hypothetical protein
MYWATFWAIFFTNASGHPEWGFQAVSASRDLEGVGPWFNWLPTTFCCQHLYELWMASMTRLPDGIFSYQNYHVGYILDGIGVDDVGIFYFRLEYFMAVRYFLLPSGMFWYKEPQCCKCRRYFCALIVQGTTCNIKLHWFILHVIM